MFSREDLSKFGPPDFTLGQKEKDYVQHWILSYLSRSGFSGVFKGGTALQKAFNLPRYSEDLDFTLGEANLPDVGALERYLVNAGFSNPEFKEEDTKISHTTKFKIGGPLYINKPVSLCSVILEFSKRELPLLKPVIITITPSYVDLLPYNLLVMDKREIASEKVRAITTRYSARDLYDLYFLLRNDGIPELRIVKEKLKYYELDFNYKLFEERVNKVEKIYLKEMNALTSQVPDYNIISKDVLKIIKKELI